VLLRSPARRKVLCAQNCRAQGWQDLTCYPSPIPREPNGWSSRASLLHCSVTPHVYGALCVTCSRTSFCCERGTKLLPRGPYILVKGDHPHIPHPGKGNRECWVVPAVTPGQRSGANVWEPHKCLGKELSRQKDQQYKSPEVVASMRCLENRKEAVRGTGGARGVQGLRREGEGLGSLKAYVRSLGHLLQARASQGLLGGRPHLTGPPGLLCC
jgi:hypothetical protein